MQIIKRGKLDWSDILEITCPDCEAVFRYMRKDTTPNYSVGLINEKGRLVQCPCCLEYIGVENAKVVDARAKLETTD